MRAVLNLCVRIWYGTTSYLVQQQYRMNNIKFLGTRKSLTGCSQYLYLHYPIHVKAWSFSTKHGYSFSVIWIEAFDLLNGGMGKWSFFLDKRTEILEIMRQKRIKKKGKLGRKPPSAFHLHQASTIFWIFPSLCTAPSPSQTMKRGNEVTNEVYSNGQGQYDDVFKSTQCVFIGGKNARERRESGKGSGFVGADF